MIYFNADPTASHVSISDKYSDYTESKMLVISHLFDDSRNPCIVIECADACGADPTCEYAETKDELAKAAIKIHGSSDNLDRLRIDSFYFKHTGQKYRCSTPAELFLHQHEIFMGSKTYGWDPYRISIYRDHIVFIMYKDGFRDFETMTLDTSSSDTRFRVELDLPLYHNYKGYLRLLSDCDEYPFLNDHHLKLCITTSGTGQTIISAAYNQSGSYIPIIKISTRDGNHTNIDRLYPIDKIMMEETLEQLLICDDENYFCW